MMKKSEGAVTTRYASYTTPPNQRRRKINRPRRETDLLTKSKGALLVSAAVLGRLFPDQADGVPVCLFMPSSAPCWFSFDRLSVSGVLFYNSDPREGMINLKRN
jgi:hypothetical protein